MDQIFIRLASDPAATLHWVRRHAGSSVAVVQQGNFEEASAAAKGCQVILIVPGDQALLSQANVPAKRSSQLRKAIPFALEDELAADVNELHFAIGPRQGDLTPVAIVDRRLMDAWVGLCHAHGLYPQVILPETLLLPFEEGHWSVLLEPDQAIIRTGRFSGFACERALLDPLLQGALEQLPAPESVRVWLCNGQQARITLPKEGPQVQPFNCGEGSLPLLANNWTVHQGINLQQGEYSNRPDIANKLRPWRWAAIFLSIWIALGFTKLLIERQQLLGQQADLNKQIEQIFRSTFPGSKNTANMRARLEQELRTLRGGGNQEGINVLSWLAASSRALATQQNTSIDAISFRNNKLELKVTSGSLSQLDALKQAIAKETGSNTELTSADSDKDKARGAISIGGGKS
jgi:general secretion pathway protein L